MHTNKIWKDICKHVYWGREVVSTFIFYIYGAVLNNKVFR
jgi:hypothetical protein